MVTDEREQFWVKHIVHKGDIYVRLLDLLYLLRKAGHDQLANELEEGQRQDGV